MQEIGLGGKPVVLSTSLHLATKIIIFSLASYFLEALQRDVVWQVAPACCAVDRHNFA